MTTLKYVFAGKSSKMQEADSKTFSVPSMWMLNFWGEIALGDFDKDRGLETGSFENEELRALAFETLV